MEFSIMGVFRTILTKRAEKKNCIESTRIEELRRQYEELVKEYGDGDGNEWDPMEKKTGMDGRHGASTS